MPGFFQKAFDIAVNNWTLKRRLGAELRASSGDLDGWFRESGEVVREMETRMRQNGLPASPADRLFAMYSRLRGQSLYALYRASKPKLIVETGVASGTSSCFALRAIERNGSGRLISIDLPNQEGEQIPGGRPVGWLVPDGLKKNWDLRLGQSEELLPALCREQTQIDVFLHDSLHTREHMLWEFRTIWPRLRKGGILASDDISMNTAFDEFQTESGCPAFKTYHRFGWIRKQA
jgi:predicted O-methyltransferase YrrM